MVSHHRIRIKYASQADIHPPTFVLFVNDKNLVGKDYLRYLENRIRAELPFAETELRAAYEGMEGLPYWLLTLRFGVIEREAQIFQQENEIASRGNHGSLRQDSLTPDEKEELHRHLVNRIELLLATDDLRVRRLEVQCPRLSWGRETWRALQWNPMKRARQSRRAPSADA